MGAGHPLSGADATARDVPGFCRDCGARAEAMPSHRCGTCGSPRLLRHAAIDCLAVAHIDCDAFYAAIEKRDDPSLLDKPLIIGGGKRGVVSTACYIARTYGVRSAMPMFEARRLCPHATVIRPDMAKYVAVGREVRAMMLALTPLVEPLSIDEAFLDLSGTERLHGASPARTLARFQNEVERRLGISVSVGLSHNKFLAKIASDLDKPRGFAVLGRDEAAAFLAERPVGFIYGVGKAGQRRFERDGIRTIADLQRMTEIELMRRYGAEGQRLARLAHGIDHRRVVPEREAKTISSETTFGEDLADAHALERKLWHLSEKVSGRMKAASLVGNTVTLKLKTADFRIRTRARSLDHPTQLAERIFESGRDLLAAEADGTAFRLIGIGVSALSETSQPDRGDLIDGRRAEAELAMDRLRARFGKGAIVKGRALAADGEE